MSKKTALLKQLKVGYFNPDNKIIDRFKLEVETYLKYMFEVQITEFHEMLGSDLSIYDLILADARFVETNFFLSWLKQFSKKMKTNKNIWTPALIMSQLTFEEETNWTSYPTLFFQSINCSTVPKRLPILFGKTYKIAGL